MELMKKTKEYRVLKKRSGRFAVTDLKGKPVNGEAKRDVLHKEGFIKLTAPSKKAEAPAEASAEGGEAQA